MKKLLEHMRHILKDPVKTVDEANQRKKEIMPILYVSIGLLVVPTILNSLFDLPFLNIFAFIGLLGTALCAFLLFVAKKAKEKFAILTCDDCKTMATFENKEAFDKFVSYEVISEHSSASVTHPGTNNGVVSAITANGISVASVSINLKCPNCGKTKTFTYQITPFKCEEKRKNVLVKEIEVVKAKLESDINEVINMYNSEKRNEIPYTIQSIHHPNYANRDKAQINNAPHVNSVKIVYHRDIDELVEGFFLNNELNGKIIK